MSVSRAPSQPALKITLSEECNTAASNVFLFPSVSSVSGFLRSDKPIGTAVVKLENLETQSEIREIVEVSSRWKEMKLAAGHDWRIKSCVSTRPKYSEL